MERLDPINLPLDCASLIEASAGTGKTYTMANLYLRLLLGVGRSALNVDQILVVTFTKAATEELKDRIRLNIRECYAYFTAKIKGEEPKANHFFAALFAEISDQNEALLRLRIAEREIDLASVFTIHSFCQKMLFQFAFDSGVRFDIELQTQQDDVLLKLAQETWRELFYPMSLNEIKFVAAELKTPDEALAQIRPYLNTTLPKVDSAKWVTTDFATHIQKYEELLSEARHYWRKNGEEIVALLVAEINKTYSKGVKKSLSRRKYQQRYIDGWIAEMGDWLDNDSNYLPKNFDRFCAEKIADSAEEGAAILEHAHFVKNQAFLTAYQMEFADKQKSMLLYQFLMRLREKWAAYKTTHKEIGFDDLLSDLNKALKGTRGKALAAQIRGQFPFAMIDEFQDTDLVQYEVFSQIFLSEEAQAEQSGFIMIGDPKQSIYQFRGADIFTYLAAAERAKVKRTLDRNWRSLTPVVQAVNSLFNFANSAHSPFIHKGIVFRSVEAAKNEVTLDGASNVNCFTQASFDEDLAAEQCAHQIQQQLKAVQQGKFRLLNLKNKQTDQFEDRNVEARDIAVLVRNGEQANKIKQTLAKRGIKSVYLSEKASVYHSTAATDLVYILRACLNPYRESSLLAAIGSAVWGLDSRAIFQTKNDESRWENLTNRFVQYQDIWQRLGVLPMLHKIFLDEGIIERLKSRIDADRQITNLFHLSELLQSAMDKMENESALLRWFETQIKEGSDSEEQQLRLESEEELIRIITIHKSKGLQYPIVWLPFVGKNSYEVKNSALSLYRDENEKWHWDFGNNSEAIKAQKTEADYAEDLRLLYVALTRAEYQLNLIVPEIFSKGWNSLHYLLSEGEIGLNTNQEIRADSYAKFNEVSWHIQPLATEVAQDSWKPSQPNTQKLLAKPFTGNIKSHIGQVTSFTALHSYHERGSEAKSYYVELIQDDDYQAVQIPEMSELTTEISDIAYQFPHSTKVGALLHSFLEDCDFEHWQFAYQADFEQLSTEAKKSFPAQQAVQTLCEKLKLDLVLVQPIMAWFEQVLTTPFGAGNLLFTLRDIKQTSRLDEWQFFLRLKNEKALHSLNKVLREHSQLARELPPLSLPQLEGFVKGFVDCLAQVSGRFYVLDYKSNFLGYLPQDYSAENLLKTMGKYRYDLQYLLYSLAVHRYLRSRLQEQYDYERDFGGVAYLFLRGMNGKPHNGVYFDKPSKALIDELDRLFG